MKALMSYLFQQKNLIADPTFVHQLLKLYRLELPTTFRDYHKANA